METDIAKHTSNDNKILDDGYFKAQQELLRESLLTDPTGGMYVVDELSNAVHTGNAYSVNASGSIAAGVTMKLLGRTGSKEVHFDHFHIDTSKGFITINLYEAPTVSVVGTPLVASNRKRNSTNTPTMITYASPTTSANGLMLEETRIFDTGGVGSNLTQGSGGIDADWVFKPNTDYMFTITNNDSTAVTFSGHFIWAEREVV